MQDLLAHTSGYQDYWPQSYVYELMLKPTTPLQTLRLWAQKPLDFQPGMQWQYSNTNYTIVGLIIEKVSGIALFEFLRQHFFVPFENEQCERF